MLSQGTVGFLVVVLLSTFSFLTAVDHVDDDDCPPLSSSDEALALGSYRLEEGSNAVKSGYAALVMTIVP